MAVLNKIRQQSLVLILVIAMALFAFILSGIFDGSASFSSKSQNVIATINGKDITRTDFMQKVELAQRQLGPNSTTSQAMNRVWNQEVREAVMNTQYDALGISVEKDQMRDLLKTSLASNPDFQNEAGIFDENKLVEYIENLKVTSSVAYKQWVDYETSIANRALEQNYMNMVKAGMIGTLAEGKLMHELESSNVDIKYVQIPYASIPDSTITVSNDEISKYINAHKKQYEVEASRNIKYVEFKEVASIEDEAELEKKLLAYKNGKLEYKNNRTDTIKPFSQAKNNGNYIDFIANSDIKFDDRFVKKNALPTSVADTIYNLNVGDVFGPYKDNGFIKLTKVVAVTQMPDSVKARHILIPFIGSRSATETTTQTEAQARTTADSLMHIIKADTTQFVSLLEYSVDKVSNEKDGVLDWFVYGTMVPEFRDYAFESVTGDIDVVKSPFGFHIIEVLGQKNHQRTIKVGTIAKKIEPSEITINKIFRDASNFEIALGKGDLQELATEKEYIVRPVNTIKELDESIPGLGSQRAIVRWAFDEETKIGDYKRFNVTGGYAVVQLGAKNKAGLMSTQDASITALPAIRKEKKATLIMSRITATTVDEFGTAESISPKTSLAITMKNPTISGAGREPLVIGTAFGMDEGETSNLIEGDTGVFMINVVKLTPAAKLDNYQGLANQVQTAKVNSVTTKLYNALKDAADIEDNRATTVQ